MIRVVALSAMLTFLACPAPAGTLLETIHSTGAQNGILVLIQPGDAVCEDAAASDFAVLALETQPEQVDGLRRRFLDRGVYGRVSASLFDGKTIPCIDELVNIVVVEGGNLVDEEVLRGAGVTEFEKYSVEPGQPLMKDLFLDG